MFLQNYKWNQIAGFLWRYGRLFVSNGFFSLMTVVITGLGIGSLIALAAYAYNIFLIEVLLCTPFKFG